MSVMERLKVHQRKQMADARTDLFGFVQKERRGEPVSLDLLIDALNRSGFTQADLPRLMEACKQLEHDEETLAQEAENKAEFIAIQNERDAITREVDESLRQVKARQEALQERVSRAHAVQGAIAVARSRRLENARLLCIDPDGRRDLENRLAAVTKRYRYLRDELDCGANPLSLSGKLINAEVALKGLDRKASKAEVARFTADRDAAKERFDRYAAERDALKQQLDDLNRQLSEIESRKVGT